MGLVGLVDYETAMARRRAIAGAEVAKDRSNYVPKSEVRVERLRLLIGPVHLHPSRSCDCTEQRFVTAIK